MWRLLLAVASLGSGAAPEDAGSPISWSPDGRWVAYVSAPTVDDAILAPGWLVGLPTPGADRPDRAPPRPHRIWATNVETGESAALAESAGPLSGVGWHPEGTALAYGQVVADDAGAARVDWMIQESPTSRRRVRTTPLDPAHTPGATWLRIARVAPTWSVDARHLAIPDPWSRSIAIVRPGDGRVEKVLDGATAPAWSADGRLAFFKLGQPDILCWIDPSFSTTHRIVEAPESSLGSDPTWTRDGRTLIALRRPAENAPPMPPPPPVAPRPRPGLRFGLVDPPAPSPVNGPALQVVRFQVDTGMLERATPIVLDPIDAIGAIRRTILAVAPDGLEFATSYLVDALPNRFSTFRLRPVDHEILCRTHPIDENSRIGVLAFSPTSNRLAIRLGSDALGGLPALCDPDGGRFLPLTPDDDAKAAWVASLVAIAGESIPPARGPLDRPSLAPIPGTISAEDPAIGKLRRLGELGRSICDRSPRLAEARLFFDLIAPDYASAALEIDEVAGRSTRPEARDRWLGLRAQVAIGRGELDRGRNILDYLQARPVGPASAIEDDPGGIPRLTPLPSRVGWLGPLRAQLSAASRGGPGNRSPQTPDLGRRPEVPRSMIEFERTAPDRGPRIERDAPEASRPVPF